MPLKQEPSGNLGTNGIASAFLQGALQVPGEQMGCSSATLKTQVLFPISQEPWPSVYIIPLSRSLSKLVL